MPLYNIDRSGKFVNIKDGDELVEVRLMREVYRPGVPHVRAYVCKTGKKEYRPACTYSLTEKLEEVGFYGKDMLDSIEECLAYIIKICLNEEAT